MADPPSDVRILHVDDDSMFLEMASTFLERTDEGIEVVTATDGQAALEWLEAESFDCVVSDYDMPGMDGLELLETVRATDRAIPFVLFTGRGSEEVASKAISAGVTEYMQKETGGEQFVVLANRVRNAVERQRAETSLGEVEARYQRMLRTSPAPVVLFDGDAVIDFANGAAAEMLGADDPDELVGRPVESFIHPESTELVGERLRTVLEEREPVPTVEQRYVGVDGQERYALIATAPVVYDGVEGGQAVLSDVTDLKAAERELLRERSFIDQALDTLDDLFYFVDMDGSVVRVNVRAAELTGYDRAELEGRSVTELFGDDVDGPVAAGLQEALAEGDVQFHAELTTSTGERVPLSLRNKRLVGPSGEPLGVLGVASVDGDDTEPPDDEWS